MGLEPREQRRVGADTGRELRWVDGLPCSPDKRFNFCLCNLGYCRGRGGRRWTGSGLWRQIRGLFSSPERMVAWTKAVAVEVESSDDFCMYFVF